MDMHDRNVSVEATGVSRFGRVRKKSSKLVDYESPNEISVILPKRKTGRHQQSQKRAKVTSYMGAVLHNELESCINDDLIEVKDEPIETDDRPGNDDGCHDTSIKVEDNSNTPRHMDDVNTALPCETSACSQGSEACDDSEGSYTDDDGNVPEAMFEGWPDPSDSDTVDSLYKSEQVESTDDVSDSVSDWESNNAPRKDDSGGDELLNKSCSSTSGYSIGRSQGLKINEDAKKPSAPALETNDSETVNTESERRKDHKSDPHPIRSCTSTSTCTPPCSCSPTQNCLGSCHRYSSSISSSIEKYFPKITKHPSTILTKNTSVISTEAPSGTQVKRKRSVLTFAKKVDLIKMVESGIPRRVVCKEYKVSTSTLYDIMKSKGKIFSYYAQIESDKAMCSRKAMSKAKVKSVDDAVWEWYRQKRKERKEPVPGWLVKQKARQFHKLMNITEQCSYTNGWLRSFKSRHGIELRIKKASEERKSADTGGAIEYVSKFPEIMQDKKLSCEQIYNVDETSLLWRMLRTTTLAHRDESGSGCRQNNERITLLCCANAAGTHKCKLLVIGNSQNPRALKGVKSLPVIYKAQESALMSKSIFLDWFDNHFVPEVKEHLRSVGLPSNSNVVLFLDNNQSHPGEDELINDNIFATFLPHNTTSLIQPMEQGIMHNLKSNYKIYFARRLNTHKGSIEDFTRAYTIKTAMWSIAGAWDQIQRSTLKNAWRKLWPTSGLFPREDDQADFEGFGAKRVSEKRKLREELLVYFREIKSIQMREALVSETLEAEIDEWIEGDEHAPTAQNMNGSELVEFVTGAGQEEQEEDEKPKESTEVIKKHFEGILNFMESGTDFNDRDMMNMYNMYTHFLNTRTDGMKQLTLEDCFERAAKKANIKNSECGSSRNHDTDTFLPRLLRNSTVGMQSATKSTLQVK